jgi:hypothetical protein
MPLPGFHSLSSMQRSSSPVAMARKLMLEVAFCHNDLLGGNVLFNEERGDVVLIDYEYAAGNYVAFDIANHFCAVSPPSHPPPLAQAPSPAPSSHGTIVTSLPHPAQRRCTSLPHPAQRRRCV